MRWVAIALALLSALLSMISAGAGVVGILPTTGDGESLLHFAGACLGAAVAAALAATGLGAVVLARDRGPRRATSSVVALAMAAASLAGSLALVAFVLFLTESGKNDQRKTVDAKLRHQAHLTDAEVRAAKTVAAETIVAEWTHNHDSSDAAHRGQILRLTIQAGGDDWVDDADCVSLLGRRDVVCCLASGEPIPTGTVELVGRYAGTDRRNAVPGKDQGKLLFDSCQAR